MDYDAYDALLHRIFRQTQGDAWFKPSAENIHAGVCLRIQTGQYRVFPYENRFLEPFEAAVRVLNPVVAVKVRSAAVHVALSTVNDDATAIYVDDDTPCPIYRVADKEQCGAFIRDERVCTSHTSAINSASSEVDINEKPRETESTTTPEPGARVKRVEAHLGRLALGMADWFKGKAGACSTARPTRYFAPVYGGLGLALSTYFIGSGVGMLLQEWRLTHDYKRFALMATTPFLFCFFALQVITNILLLTYDTRSLGPVAQYHENSKYYSAVKPAANKEVDAHPTLILLSSFHREERIRFYADHGIGWVCTAETRRSPRAGSRRRGRFKKASTMNYGLALSLKMEETIRRLEIERGEDMRNRRARMAEVILIVDSDTIVQSLQNAPEVAIIQHDSDVMQVAHHYFENGIAQLYPTTPRFNDPGDNDKKKIWSETNVSEDFDMALRLQLKGYIIRWATYSEGGFKEGVSLTCDDELNRWQKYSYGCNELIFNPLVQWWRLGPINKQLRIFLWSDAPVHYKVSMMSYMFSYYGLAAAALLSLLNYLILGLSFNVDGFYEHSFEIWLACTVVFPGAGNLGYTLLEYRLGQRSLVSSFLENITWVPFFFFFFGGLSIHLSQALLAHLFSYNITWGATKKEVERSRASCAVFWLALVISFLMFVMIIVFSTNLVPPGWQIPGVDWAVIFPLAVVAGSHILFPIVLNPWLMIFSY
ncbi:glycosyl transferase family group 2-domain-containing protein [Russula emetica]|nr:glycosyl transferase family group 2-domain-containing protein [Russula emetica]